MLGLGKDWRLVEARLEASSSNFMLKGEETVALSPDESARAGSPMTFQDYVVPMQWWHINVFNEECVIVCALESVTPPSEGHSKRFSQE